MHSRAHTCSWTRGPRTSSALAPARRSRDGADGSGAGRASENTCGGGQRRSSVIQADESCVGSFDAASPGESNGAVAALRRRRPVPLAPPQARRECALRASSSVHGEIRIVDQTLH